MKSRSSSKPRGNKLYRGAFEYIRQGKKFSEEEFEVYKSDSGIFTDFFAEMTSRVATGELLKIYTEYKFNKDYVPVSVLIVKELGQTVVQEYYSFDTKTNKLFYMFKDEENTTELELGPPTKFHIATPLACVSMTYLRSKKNRGDFQELL